VVYINLKEKPEWIFEKNPGGKVPTLELRNGKILYESLVVADYLDEVYPGPTLTPADPFQKASDRILIENFSKVCPG
jgi:glutathione S-transferase